MTTQKRRYTKLSQGFFNLFQGRLRRRSFVLPFLLFFVLPVYIFIYFRIDFIFLIFSVCALSCLPITIKRVRDVGLSGWFALLSGIPLLNILLTLVLLLYPGTKGVNAYGDVPKVSIWSEIVRNIVYILYAIVIFIPTAFFVIVYEYSIDVGVEPHPLWNLPRDHPQYDPRYDPQCLNTYDPEYDPDDEFCVREFNSF